MQHQRTAFSLIEVLTALVLLGLLVSTLVPTWMRIRSAESHIQLNTAAYDYLIHLPIDDVRTLLNDGSAIHGDYFIQCTALQHTSINEELSASLWVQLRATRETDESQELAHCVRLLFVEHENSATSNNSNQNTTNAASDGNE